MFPSAIFPKAAFTSDALVLIFWNAPNASAPAVTNPPIAAIVVLTGPGSELKALTSDVSPFAAVVSIGRNVPPSEIASVSRDPLNSSHAPLRLPMRMPACFDAYPDSSTSFVHFEMPSAPCW